MRANALIAAGLMMLLGATLCPAADSLLITDFDGDGTAAHHPISDQADEIHDAGLPAPEVLAGNPDGNEVAIELKNAGDEAMGGYYLDSTRVGNLDNRVDASMAGAVGSDWDKYKGGEVYIAFWARYMGTPAAGDAEITVRLYEEDNDPGDRLLNVTEQWEAVIDNQLRKDGNWHMVGVPLDDGVFARASEGGSGIFDLDGRFDPAVSDPWSPGYNDYDGNGCADLNHRGVLGVSVVSQGDHVYVDTLMVVRPGGRGEKYDPDSLNDESVADGAHVMFVPKQLSRGIVPAEEITSRSVGDKSGGWESPEAAVITIQGAANEADEADSLLWACPVADASKALIDHDKVVAYKSGDTAYMAAALDDLSDGVDKLPDEFFIAVTPVSGTGEVGWGRCERVKVLRDGDKPWYAYDPLPDPKFRTVIYSKRVSN